MLPSLRVAYGWIPRGQQLDTGWPRGLAFQTSNDPETSDPSSLCRLKVHTSSPTDLTQSLS